MRFFICEFVQESNSFNPTPTLWDDFASSGIFEGDALVTAGMKAGATVGGMLDAIQDAGHTAVGGVRMRSKSGGPVDHKIVDWFIEKNLAVLREMNPPDALLISLHGATLSDRSEDVCGDILQAIRDTVGKDAIIAATADLHGNITEKFARNCNIICGYQTYPHVDMYETGQRAGKLAIEMAAGRPLKTVYVTLPIIAPAHGYTTGSGPLQQLMEKGHAAVNSGAIADFTVFQVQPWMDIKELHSAVVIVAEDITYATHFAKELANEELKLRHSLLGAPLLSVEEVIQKARENTADAPVILVDSADSPNAGAVGDCATVLQALLPYRDELRVAVSVNDAVAVEKAFALGVGGTGDFELGATLAPKLSQSVTVPDCVVKSLHRGDIYLAGPAERGQYRDMGKSAVLQAGKILILINTRGQNYGDKQAYRGFGIDPSLCDLVCVKACTSFRAGYEPISAEICNTITPGAACPLLSQLPYSKLPHPFFPFDEIGQQDISPIKICR